MSTPVIAQYSPYVFGIDLGTTNSCLAIHLGGEGTVVPLGNDTTMPSVMRVLDNGDIQIGKSAKRGVLVAPEETVSHVKRHLGTPWKKSFKGIPGREYGALDISAEILSALVSKALEGESLDLKGTPRRAVICIPANFQEDQRRETIEAARLANLEVLALLEEPSAAAIAYATDRQRDQTILVYDLGGGTFDVSILQVHSDADGRAEIKILGKGGIAELGGIDFDRKMMQLVAKRFEAESGIDIFDLKKDQEVNAKVLREAQAKLQEACEEAKKELTDAPSAEFIIPSFLKDGSGKTHDIAFQITRDEFDAEIGPLVAQTKTTIEEVLASTKLSIEDISRIVLVGGSTLVPLVRKMLTEFFGREPYSDANPNTIVARGAAIYAAAMTAPVDAENAGVREISIYDKVSHHLGIEIFGGKFFRLLERGMDIPPADSLEASRAFITAYDDCTEIRVSVYQADDTVEFVRDDGARCIGEFFVSGLPARPKGEEKVEITFSIDQQNLLRISAKASTSEENLEIARR